MFNFLKRKKPILYAWSFIPGVEEVAPIKPSIDFIPNWFKKMPKYSKDSIVNNYPVCTGTTKSCPGITDFLCTGYILPAWCDFEITINDDGDIHWRTPFKDFVATVHPASQFVQYLPNNFKQDECWVIKLVSPWRVETDSNHRLMLLNPFFHFESDGFSVIPGIRESDFYHDTNVFLLFTRKGRYVIRRGEPLATLLPVRKEKFDFKILPFTEKLKAKHDKITVLVSSRFSNAYKDEVIKRKQKCPFDV